MLSPLLGPPSMQWLCSTFALLWAPREGRGEVATFGFVPVFGDPREQALCSTSALFWAPAKAGVRQLILILSPLLGTPGNAGGCVVGV